MKQVADFFFITPPSATSLIDSLVKSKMLKRLPDKNDRRVIHLILTPKGEKTLKKNFAQMTAQIKKVFTCLNEKERKQLISIYKKISDYFQASE